MNRYMLKIALVLCATSANAAEEAQLPQTVWRTARVLKVDVLESLPPAYNITYVGRCNDKQAKVVKIATASETIIGVAVERERSASGCRANEPRAALVTLREPGETSDPSTVRILR